MELLVAVTFAALVDPLAFEPQLGPFATLDAACTDLCQFVNRNEDSAFFQRRGEWYVALRGPDGWFSSRLPIQIGVTPERVSSEAGVRRVCFAQHAFDATVDLDAEWVWPCVAGVCAAQPVPLAVRDRSRGVDVEIAGQLRSVPIGAGRWRLDVIFTRVKLAGTGEWRTRVESLRGSHTLALP